MASYQIEWKQSAVKDLRKLPKTIITRILASVDALASDPYPHGAIKLTGSDSSYRIRIGNYRIVYTIDENLLRIEIVRVRHRREVYR
jgi:mRNA interferase RelE/StbE